VLREAFSIALVAAIPSGGLTIVTIALTLVGVQLKTSSARKSQRLYFPDMPFVIAILIPFAVVSLPGPCFAALALDPYGDQERPPLEHFLCVVALLLTTIGIASFAFAIAAFITCACASAPSGHHCRSCGYDRSGPPTDANCPECGADAPALDRAYVRPTKPD
jgi:hypothetical protein